MEAVLKVGSHKSAVEGQAHLPQSAGHAAFDGVIAVTGILVLSLIGSALASSGSILERAGIDSVGHGGSV